MALVPYVLHPIDLAIVWITGITSEDRRRKSGVVPKSVES